MRFSRAKLIYRAAHQPISPHSLSNATRVDIAALLKAGILIENDTRCFVPAPDVLESLSPAAAT